MRSEEFGKQTSITTCVFVRIALVLHFHIVSPHPPLFAVICDDVAVSIPHGKTESLSSVGGIRVSSFFPEEDASGEVRRCV